MADLCIIKYLLYLLRTVFQNCQGSLLSEYCLWLSVFQHADRFEVRVLRCRRSSVLPGDEGIIFIHKQEGAVMPKKA